MTDMVMEGVKFELGLSEAIKAVSIRERDKGGYEAVGFLARRTRSDIIGTFFPLNNHSADPQHGFFVEPWEQFRAERKLAEADYVIAGVYHSHPLSEARPSGADVAMARPGELMVIYSVAFDELGAWRESEGRLNEVALQYVTKGAGRA